MASRRTKLFAGATTVVAGAGVYFLYSVMAVQGQGTLAQAPLNVQVQIPPAFIMALDDSGSMLWENLNNTRDGVFVWDDNTGGVGDFYTGGVPRGYDQGDERFYYVFPPYGRGNDNGAIPPLDAFGFARSPDVNPSYFDPRISYTTWKNADGTDYQVINPASAPLDPRPAASPAKIGGTLDLTANAEATANNWRFRVRRGMVIPVGTRLRGACNATNGNINTGANYAEITGMDRRATQDCNVHFSYFPATFFLAEGSVLPPGYGYTATPVAVTDPPGGRPGTLRKYEIKPENFGSAAEYEAAMQNFANWFSFYRVRREGLIGSTLNALVDVSSMRVGWFRINNRSGVTMRDMSNATDKQALFTDIRTQMRASDSTPNRQAVRHLGEQFKRTGAGAPVQLSCQKNAGMLFTDGYINDAGSPNVGGNLDGALGPPFSDSFNNTMADVVVPYYYESLVPGLEQNAVPVPAACSSVSTPLLPEERALDCQTNLHMNFYGIVLGTLGNQFGVSYLPSVADESKLTPDPYLNPPVWQARADLQPQAVDEMWHATLNARGEMINATTPAAITAAMRRVLASVSAGASPAGSIALTGARVGTGTLAVVPFYEARNNGTDWYSTLTAQTVSVAPGTGVVSFPTAWEVTAKYGPGPRTGIWYGRGNAVPLEFTADNIGTLDRLCDNPRPGMSLCTAGLIAGLGGTPALTLGQAIDYLKGDQSLEVERNPVGKLRFRTTPLGDIVNSTPVVSAPTDDYGYRGLPAPYGASYQTYLSTTKASRRPMVYSGANDGMLHGFDGRTGDPGGRERFAFIPQSVVGHMGNLLFPYVAANGGDQRFKHRYYVDGPVAVSDAYDGAEWKTVLVGSTGAGARGAFGLDVSGVSAASGNFDADDRLWEVSDVNMALTSAVRENIGHVLGRPVIVPVKTGTGSGPVTWRAIFGNGYNSISGKAVLYMVDIGTGVPVVRMLEAREATAPAAGTNGLGNIVVVDRWGVAGDNTLTARTRDGFADTVYAADQKGAIWKFDLRDATTPGILPATPDQTRPVFTTLTYTSGPQMGTRQPIIGGLTAAQGPGGGVMVYFGSGSFSFDGDATDNSLQSLYAVLDTSTGDPTTTVDRSDLLMQAITASSAGTRSTSSNVATVLRSGWYLDLPVGERFVGYPRVESGLLFMPTYAPNSATSCSTAGVNWLYGLNALSGAAGLSNVRFDSPTGTSPGAGTGAVALDTQGTAPVKDVAVLTTPRLQPLGAGATPAEIADALAAQCSMVIQVAGAKPIYLRRPCGRQSWRQIQ